MRRSTSRLSTLMGGILCGTLAAPAGCADGASGPPAGTPAVFSFEGGMEGWTAYGIDLEVGGDEIDWSISPSRDRASAGAQSLKLYLDNMTDAGKIWVERPIAVRPNRSYDVRIELALASADYGATNLFRVIAGALPAPPRTREELAPAYQDHTGNGSDADVGYRWLSRSYSAKAHSGAMGRIYVVLGVWGTWETPRTYYVDDVRITLVER